MVFFRLLPAKLFTSQQILAHHFFDKLKASKHHPAGLFELTSEELTVLGDAWSGTMLPDTSDQEQRCCAAT